MQTPFFGGLARALAAMTVFLSLRLSAAPEFRQAYNLPADEAGAALRLFSDRSGQDVLFATGSVRGVRTNPVRGDFTPREALDRMLAGTVLAATADERSGALAVSRKDGLVPGGPPVKKRTVAAESAPNDPERVVRLEEFTVGTTLGSYAETTTSAGSKTPTEMKALAGTLQVLNAAFIEDKQAQSLEDLYPYIVGMTRESPAALGFTLRGFSNNLTNTLLNNIQTDGLPGLASRFGSPTTANVERVEVIKGPNSVLYGSMNPGGIINIVTKQPSRQASHSFSTTVASFAGHNSPLGADLSMTGTLDSTGAIDRAGHWLYRGIAAYEDVSGFRQFSWGKNTYFFPALTWRPDDDTELTLKLDFSRQHRFSDQYLVAPFKLIANVAAHNVSYQDRNNVEYDRGDTYAFVFSHRFENRWTLKVNSRDVQHADGRNPLENRAVLDAIPLESSVVAQRWRDTWNRRRYAYYDANIYGDIGPEGFRHTLLFGANAGYETHDFLRWIFADLPGGVNVYQPVHDTRPYPYAIYDPARGPSQNAVAKYYNAGLYVSDQLAVGKTIHISAGLHAEAQDLNYTDHAIGTRFTSRSSSTVPSLGFVYQPVGAVALYATYAESFKPSVPQNRGADGRDFAPERADQVEFGVKADFLGNKLGVLASVYDIRRRNVSEAVPLMFFPDGVQIYRLIGQQRSQGVELSVNYQPQPYFQMQLGYTYDDARTTQSLDPALINARNENAPRQSANFWSRYNVPVGGWRGLGAGLGLIHVGERNGLTTNVAASSLRIPANTRLDLALYYRWRRYEFAMNVTNVLDLAYIASADSPIDVVPGAPRKITASLKLAF
jgi:iron complex outermembrane receptor protein